MKGREEKREEERRRGVLLRERAGEGRNRRETEGRRSKERVRARQKFTQSYRFSFTPAPSEIARVQLGASVPRILSSVAKHPTLRDPYVFPRNERLIVPASFPSRRGRLSKREKGIVCVFISRDCRRLERKGPGQGPT